MGEHRRCAKEWSRSHTSFASPTPDVIKIGALLRIADSLERIDSLMRKSDPAEKEREAKRDREAEKHAVIEAWLVDKPRIDLVSLRQMAFAFIRIMGIDADHTRAANWIKVADAAPSRVPAIGKLRAARIREWAEKLERGGADAHR